MNEYMLSTARFAPEAATDAKLWLCICCRFSSDDVRSLTEPPYVAKSKKSGIDGILGLVPNVDTLVLSQCDG